MHMQYTTGLSSGHGLAQRAILPGLIARLVIVVREFVAEAAQDFLL
jgi:hypothetical protein